VRSDRDRSVGPAAPGSAAAPRVIGEPACRRMDDAEDRDALIDERDVDRVLTVPGEELARPVERVDQPEPAREPFDRRHAFFRDHDGAGIELRESLPRVSYVDGTARTTTLTSTFDGRRPPRQRGRRRPHPLARRFASHDHRRYRRTACPRSDPFMAVGPRDLFIQTTVFGRPCHKRSRRRVARHWT
jgi:hypothetical protein